MNTSGRHLFSITTVAALLLALCPVAANSAEPGQSDEEALVAAGLKAFYSGEYAEAEGCFKDALGVRKDSAPALEGMLELFIETGRYDEAAAFGMNASFARGKALGAEALAARGKYKEAVSAFESALSLDNSLLRAREELGETLILLGNGTEAKKHFDLVTDAALERDILTAEDYVAIARERVQTNHFSDAVNYFEKAYQTDSKYTPLYVPWAYALLEKYNIPHAKKTFKELLGMNPRHPDGLVGLAYTMLSDDTMGPEKYSKARETAEQALESNPAGTSALYFLAYLAFIEENHSETLERLERVFKINPKETSAFALAAAIYYIQGDKPRFEEARKRAFDVNPRNAKFYDELSSIVDQRYLYAEAQEFALKALEIDNETWSAYFRAGINMTRAGDLKTGRDYLEKSFKFDPFNVRCYNTLEILDVMKKTYIEEKFGNYVLRLENDTSDVLEPLYREEMERLIPELAKKYGLKPDGPYFCETFDRMDYFSGRIVGLPGMPALGVCFGKLIVVASPVAIGGREVWGATLRHELAHTVTLTKTNFRCPRWFTEGISVHEEKCGRPEWDREFDYQFFCALKQGNLLSIGEINRGFHRPKDFNEILLAYYEAHVIVEYILANWGQAALNRLLDGFAALKTADANFKDVLGVTLAEFDKRFLEHCEKLVSAWKIRAPYTSRELKRLKTRIEDGDKSADAYAELAKAYIDNGKPKDAGIQIALSLQADPNHAAALITKGLMALSNGDNSAVELLEKALKLAPKYPNADTYSAHKALTAMLLKDKKHSEAVEHLLSMKAAFNRDVQVYRALANSYKELGKEKERRAVMEEMVAFDHTDMQFRNELAKLYHTEKVWAKLETIAIQMIYLTPFNAQAQYYLGECGRAKDNLKSALAHYHAAEKLAKNARSKDAPALLKDIYAALADCYKKTGDAAKAKTYEELSGGSAAPAPPPPEKKDAPKKKEVPENNEAPQKDEDE
jgi:Tfp pilus assembly protein PilF